MIPPERKKTVTRKKLISLPVKMQKLPNKKRERQLMTDPEHLHEPTNKFHRREEIISDTGQLWIIGK